MTQVIINDVLPYTQATAILNQTIFSTNWTANVASDVQVYQTPFGNSPDDVTQLLNTSQYSVSFIGALLEVRITLVTPAGAGDIITIVRDTPADRLNLYSNTNFVPSMLNNDFGILTLVDQQSQLVDQLIGPRYNYSAVIVDVLDTILPILAANQIWAKNNNNTAFIPYTLPSSGIAPSNASYVLLTPNAGLVNSQALSSFGASGLLAFNNGTDLIQETSITGTANQITVTNGTGLSTINISIPSNPIIPGTAGMGIPQGTTAQRVIPGTGIGLRFNTDLNQLEYFTLATWFQINSSGAVLALLASHVAGQGASLVGLQGAGTVQDLAPTTDGQLAIGQTAGVPVLATLTQGSGVTIVNGPGSITISAAGTGGTVTSISAGLGITLTPNPIIATGTVALTNPLPLAIQSNITQLGAQTQALDMNTHLIDNVVDPVSAQDAATKNYVDNLISDFASIFVARLASTVALTVTYANGAAGIGATLTNAGAQAALTLDGVAAVVNDLVLIKNQASALQNGYYVVTNIGSGATNWVLTRSTKYDTPTEIQPGDLFVITTGSTQVNTTWIQTATVTAVGTDSISFSQFSVALPIPVNQGGSGLTSVTAHDLMIGNGTSPFTLLAPSATSGVPLISQGAASDPAYGTTVVAGGGTGLTSVTAHDLMIGNGTSALTLLAPSATSGVPLISQGASSDPAYGTTVVAGGGTGLTSVTAHDLMIGNGTSALTLLAPSATSGVPLISQGASANPVYGTALVVGGGTGAATFTAFSVLCAGTTATGAFQNVSGLGSSGQILTSNGAGALPTWQASAVASGITSVMKSGSGSGTDYTTSSASYVDVDLTNLSYTVTVPVGYKIHIHCALSMYSTSTGTCLTAIVDGTTVLAEARINNVTAQAVGAPISYIFTGDGASHTFKLQFKQLVNNTFIINQSATSTAFMTFLMLPSS